MSEAPSQTRRLVLIALAAAAVIGAVAGWHLFYFLCDDAFIAFRYVSNSVNGRGFVWNAAPFKPVEGYTSFLWVVVLREVWSLLGIEPPAAAGVLSLLFGLGTLALCFSLALRMALPPAMEKSRLVLLALALLGTLTNPTFLEWLSSGLETALFNFLLTWWLFESLHKTAIDRPARAMRLTMSAALCALCRPDGLLVVAGTVVQLAVSWREGKLQRAWVWPLGLVPAHLLWRRYTYDAWLPNTWYAKYGSPWPEAGVRYLASFLIEFSVWIWLLMALVWSIRTIAQRPWAQMRPPQIVSAITVLVLIGHWAFYTFAVGGDHFEYRVYSQLIPLLFLSAGWMATRIVRSGAVAAVLVALFVVASWPIPWTHYAVAHELTTRAETYQLHVTLADRVPLPFRPWVAVWDHLQGWLIDHYDCMRWEEHKAFWLDQLKSYPPRSEGIRFGKRRRKVLYIPSVGVPGWTLPNVDIIDAYGLNDRTIAREGVRSTDIRRMAHDIYAPPGYVDCFRPNIIVENGRVETLPGREPLSDDEVRDCESRDWSATAATVP